VVSDFDFPPTRRFGTAQSRAAHARSRPRASDGYIPAEMSKRPIDDKRMLVAITHVCFSQRRQNWTFPHRALARAKGARVLWTAISRWDRSISTSRRWMSDFAAGGMLKYLLGTAGIGFLYAENACVRSLVPTNSGWFAQAEIAAMDISANRPAPNARRFEAGTPPVVQLLRRRGGPQDAAQDRHAGDRKAQITR